MKETIFFISFPTFTEQPNRPKAKYYAKLSKHRKMNCACLIVCSAEKGSPHSVSLVARKFWEEEIDWDWEYWVSHDLLSQAWYLVR